MLGCRGESSAEKSPTTICKLAFRSASILLVTPQLPTIQSIPEGWNQVRPLILDAFHLDIYHSREEKTVHNFCFIANFKWNILPCSSRALIHL